MTSLVSQIAEVPNFDAPFFPKRVAAEYLGISVRSLDRLRARGAIGYTRVGGQVRFRLRDLVAFTISHEVKALAE